MHLKDDRKSKLTNNNNNKISAKKSTKLLFYLLKNFITFFLMQINFYFKSIFFLKEKNFSVVDCFSLFT